MTRDQSRQKKFEITPLGAAIVEALPDQKRKKEIQRQFEKHRKCPASLMFDAGQVEQYYADRGEKVTAVQTPPTAPVDADCYAEFGRMAFEYVKECISEGCFEHEVETLAELAVKAGLMVYEPYDPAKHNIKFTHYDYEPGDMIYYWGKPSA